MTTLRAPSPLKASSKRVTSICILPLCSMSALISGISPGSQQACLKRVSKERHAWIVYAWPFANRCLVHPALVREGSYRSDLGVSDRTDHIHLYFLRKILTYHILLAAKNKWRQLLPQAVGKGLSEAYII